MPARRHLDVTSVLAALALLAAGGARPPIATVANGFRIRLKDAQSPFAVGVGNEDDVGARCQPFVDRLDEAAFLQKKCERILVWRCLQEGGYRDDCGGLGDRLIGIVSSFVAAVSSERCFFIWWPAADAVFEQKNLVWNFEHILESSDLAQVVLKKPLLAALDTLRNNTVQMPPPSKSSLIKTGYSDIHLLNAIHDRSALVAIGMNYKPHKSKQFLIVQAAWGIVSQKGVHVQPLATKLTSDGDPHLSEQFGCFLRYLLAPIPRLARASGTSPSTRIGIHLRVGDSVLKKGGQPEPDEISSLFDHFKFLFNCAERVDAHLNNTAVWAVFSDSDDLKKHVRMVYGDKVVITNVAAEHIDQRVSFHRLDSQNVLEAEKRSLQTTVVDWLEFSTSDAFVIQRSGWASTAIAFSLRADGKIWVSPHRGADKKGHMDEQSVAANNDLDRWCNIQQPKTIPDLMSKRG